MNKNKRVIYEIFTPSFCKDFKDLADKVPYFVELGVTSVMNLIEIESEVYHGC